MRRTFNITITAAALLAVSINLSPQSYAEDQLASEAYPGELAIEALTESHGVLAGQWDISVGFDYSRGKYGALRATNVYYTPFGAGYRKGRWSVSVDSGYVSVKGPVDYASILDLTPEDVAALGLDTETISVGGLADTVVGARYAAFEWFNSGTFIDVGMRVKLPTASEAKGLGSGKVTGDVQVDVTQLYGSWSFLIAGSYGFRSHENDGRDVQSVSVGVGRSMTRKLAVGAVFDWRTSPRPGGSKGRELVAYGSFAITPSLALTAYAVRGFSRASVENSAGLRFRYRFP